MTASCLKTKVGHIPKILCTFNPHLIFFFFGGGWEGEVDLTLNWGRSYIEENY